MCCASGGVVLVAPELDVVFVVVVAISTVCGDDEGDDEEIGGLIESEAVALVVVTLSWDDRPWLWLLLWA